MSLTPMMEQYFQIKGQYKQCLLMFRLGDFYEMFFDDAVVASKELGIVLTGRDCGQAERAPMCGVPFHAADNYIGKLVEKGFHVAICEQVEDPKQAKGIVKREVIRVVTPGTVLDAGRLDEGRHNFITCLNDGENGIGCATADITTGLFMVTALPGGNENKLLDELARLSPAEIICAEGFPYRNSVAVMTGLTPYSAPAWTFYPKNAFKCLTEHFNTLNLEGFGLKQHMPEVSAAGALLQYLSETQKHALKQITSIKHYSQLNHMALDMPSRRNLELTAAIHTRNKKDSLLGVLDRTETPMGARLLKSWVEQPLIMPKEIQRRLDAVEELVHMALLRAELKELLRGVHDLERLMAKLASNIANARDMSALRSSFSPLPHIRTLLSDMKTGLNTEIYRSFDDLSDIRHQIDKMLTDDPPAHLREGGLIKPGYSKELDELLSIKENGRQWLRELEAREREATGIKNLKIRFNKVFGYYIEVTQSYIHLAPERYTRRQTLANCERFTTDELKQLEIKILNAESTQTELEFNLFDALRREVVDEMARVQFTSYALAAIDALTSLADAAERNRYCKPVVNDGGIIRIKEGRHPVVERRAAHEFVPNDTHLDNTNRLSIITGPNMAGKSTYMRQVALITLMAQMGSFVPAESAEIGVTDRIFTRVGASDDLATGQSTFMVEMTEVANILNNATPKSLVILDEIGRGTSTFDGLSIAWAVLEYIAEKINARTLFATHYHELTELEGRVDRAANYCFTVREQGEDIIFLRKLTRGGAGISYGIHVARLAGLPGAVLARARELLEKLNEADIVRHDKPAVKPQAVEPQAASTDKQLRLLADTLNSMDVLKITPLEAIMELERLKAMVI